MKNKMNYLIAASFAVMTILFTFTSCEKDEGKLLDISFKTGGNYTSADKTVNAGDTVLVGINAAKTEEEDVLKTFTITRKIDGGTESTLQTISLTGSQGDNFSQDFELIAGTAGTSELYKFTVTNRDGLINNVSLTLTVQ